MLASHRHFVNWLLKNYPKHTISVHNTVSWEVKRSRSKAEILEACTHTDEATLRVRDDSGEKVAWAYVVLQYNEAYTLTDWSGGDNEIMTKWEKAYDDYETSQYKNNPNCYNNVTV